MANKAKTKPRKPKKLSRTRKPQELSVAQWQTALRRQYGREQNYRLKNQGDHPIFSEFAVTNPESGRTYRVAIRGQALGENYCSCPDFAVNELGTCKHIEFTLEKLSQKRGAKSALAMGYQPEYSEIYLQYGAGREIVFRPGVRCPDGLRQLAKRYFDTAGRLKPEAFGGFHNFLTKATGGKHEVRCYEDALAFIAQVRDQAALENNVGKTFSRGVASAAWKDLLKVPLYPYQRRGALFAAKTGRCLIADDMGLGKTIQAIAAAEILSQHAGLERVLVVSPTSLKHQWQEEIEKFSGRPTQVVEGPQPRRAECYRQESFYKLTNYDVIHRDLDLIRQWRPELIILDEAQRIKNWKTRTAQCVKQLDSEYAFVLTGTPLENRLEELHSIVEFIDRFRLGPMYRFLSEHQHVDETGRVVGYRNLSRISHTLKPILVRRTKDKVLKELPQRMDKRLFVPMTKQQAALHEENRETVARIVCKWRKLGFLTEKDQLLMRIALQNMRMVCNSTYLLDQHTDHGHKVDEAIELLSEMLEDPGVKVVIFSQWTRTHKLLKDRIESEGWGHVFFHGGVPSPKRKGLVNRFREDPDCRLFLSTDAGGVGLNLQNASAVINFDQPWNPAVLEQRIGRVHRLGQKRPVRVVHLIAEGAIEHGMLDLLKFKRSMFTGVLDGGKDEVFMGGSRLKKFMESVEKATDSIPPSVAPPEAESAVAVELKDEPVTPQTTDDAPRNTASTPLVQQTAAKQTTDLGSSPPAASEQAWADVLSAGATLLESFTRAMNSPAPNSSDDAAGSGLPAGMVARDEATGRSYLKLPMPEPEVAQKIFDVIGALIKGK